VAFAPRSEFPLACTPGLLLAAGTHAEALTAFYSHRMRGSEQVMDPLREPWISLRRLLRFAGRVLESFLRNRGLLLAGGVGYNALLSLVPFLALAVGALSVFFDEARILGMLRSELTELVPQHADTILETAETFLRNQATANVVSVALLLFFSSIAFRMMEEAVAAIFHTQVESARRSLWVSAVLPYLFMLILMIALFAMTLLTYSLDALGERSVRLFAVDRSLEYAVEWLLRLANFVGLVLLFAAIYRVLPVVRISVRRALIGGLSAAVLWRLVARFMVYFFTNISMVNVIYGSLATVIVVLLYLEIAFIILLLGAQLIAELEASSAAGLPWYEKPPGRLVHRSA
jgi:YihY family inner membrane protein